MDVERGRVTLLVRIEAILSGFSRLKIGVTIAMPR